MSRQVLREYKLSTFLNKVSFRLKLAHILQRQVEHRLNTDGAHSGDLCELVQNIYLQDPGTFKRFSYASASSFRRFTETVMTLVELEIADASAIEEHGRSKERIGEFLAGKLTRHEFYYGQGSHFRLRQMAASVNVRNDLKCPDGSESSCTEVLDPPREISFAPA